MTRRPTILMCAATIVLGPLAFGAWWARDVPKVATGFMAGVLCSETFVSGLEPATIFAETAAAMPGAGLISWALDYRVDRPNSNVIVTLLGFGRSHSVYREGYGCQKRRQAEQQSGASRKHQRGRMAQRICLYQAHTRQTPEADHGKSMAFTTSLFIGSIKD